jgi:hypothetical protein
VLLGLLSFFTFFSSSELSLIVVLVVDLLEITRSLRLLFHLRLPLVRDLMRVIMCTH